MLLSLPLSLAGNAAGIADLLNVSALLIDSVLVRRCIVFQQEALSQATMQRVQLALVKVAADQAVERPRAVSYYYYYYY